MMADPNDPLDWNNIARMKKLAGDPAFANWVDPDDPMGWNDIARAAKAAGDPNYADWTDPYAHLLPSATGAETPAAATPAAETPGVTPVESTPQAEVIDTGTFDSLAAYLNEAGLGSLFAVGPDGAPSGWLWDQIVAGNDTAAGLRMAIEQTDEFKQRYPIIGQLRAAGSSYIPNVGDVREYEDIVANVFRRAGLPAFMYDDPLELQAYMGTFTSAAEIEERLGGAYSRVTASDPAVRAAFETFYGVGQGDAAMASFFLDPEKTMTALDKYGRAAYASGMGSSIGVTMDKNLAEKIANLPMTEGGIMEGLRNVNSQASLLDEGFTETEDLTDATAIGSTFFGDGNAQTKMEQRLIARQANERSSFGGGIITQEGLTGVRSA